MCFAKENEDILGRIWLIVAYLLQLGVRVVPAKEQMMLIFCNLASALSLPVNRWLSVSLWPQAVPRVKKSHLFTKHYFEHQIMAPHPVIWLRLHAVRHVHVSTKRELPIPHPTLPKAVRKGSCLKLTIESDSRTYTNTIKQIFSHSQAKKRRPSWPGFYTIRTCLDASPFTY